MVKTTVSLSGNGQYKVTIPKGLAEGYNLDGKKLDWEVKSGSKLQVTIVDE